ncbi:MAG: HD domain-containing protein [Candidatus Peribacteraceae bacterium]|nr:HD domain-containing protein [Candidatus Peribacteraceae bacterium]
MMINPSSLRAAIGYLQQNDIDRVQRAFDLAVTAHEGQKRGDGTPYVTHVIAVAEIIAGWQGDSDTLCAALLHDTLEDTTVTKGQISEEFGKHVSLLIEGVTKFSKADFSDNTSLDSKIETIRRLFEVMRRDIRVIIIKLADRLHNIRTISTLPTADRRVRFARETMDVYYKLALRLGMRGVRREYADVCIPYLLAQGQQWKDLRDELCRQNAAIPHMIQRDLDVQSDRLHPDINLQCRDLFLFSEMLRKKGGGTAVVTDAFVIVVITDTEDGCYQLLKSLHTLYRPVSNQFRDYIAAPGDTGYKSLHTSVTLPGGQVIEMRIRTWQMHEQAEKGIVCALFSTAHGTAQPTFDWLIRSQEIDLQTRESSSAFWEGLESDILREGISITVNGQRVSLPKGATALDAVYSALDAQAGKTMAILLSGRPVHFSQVLIDDDDVHATFDENEHVTFDWLKNISTRHARSLIVEVLKHRSQSEKVVLGATLLQKEFDYYKKGLVQQLKRNVLQEIASHFRRDNFNDVLSMIGEGAIRARDVLFFLYPADAEKSAGRSHAGGVYTFRLSITGAQERQQDILAQLTEISRESDVSITHTSVRFDTKTGIFSVTLSGSTIDRLHFADFVDALERQDSISSVQTLIPYREKLALVGAMSLSFIVILADVILLPQYPHWLAKIGDFSRVLIQVLPFIPILLTTSYLLRTLRRYVVRMRTDRWFLGVGFLLNVIGLMLIIVRVAFSEDTVSSGFLPLMAIFVLSLFFLGYQFFQTEILFSRVEKTAGKPLSSSQWRSLKKQKVLGYGIRLLAVIIWGTEPIYIKYTAANDLSPFLRTFLLGIGVLIPSALIYLFRLLRRKRLDVSFALPYDRYFILLVVGQIGYMYFKNASLLYTSGTNLLLFNNFAPLIGLLIASFFWRKDISYLREPRNILFIFMLAIAAGIGSSMLVYNGTISHQSTSIAGDALAMISTFFDVLMTIGQIEYIKRFRSTDGSLLNIHIFLFLLLFTAPVVLVGALTHSPILSGLTMHSLLLGLGIGLFVGFGQLLNYEAFKRIDGYLAFMMFNLSILITFLFEVFFVHSLKPTPLLIVSGLLIITASLSAEFINSRAQKKGL